MTDYHVSTITKTADQLQPGDMILSGSRVITLVEFRGYMSGYYAWNHSTITPAGTRYGHINLRRDDNDIVVLIVSPIGSDENDDPRAVEPAEVAYPTEPITVGQWWQAAEFIAAREVEREASQVTP